MAISAPARRRTYWLSAPEDFDTRDVEAAFSREGWLRLSPSPSLLGSIRRAPFVVGVVGRPGANESVFFEVGFAVGARRRVALLTTRGAESQPGALESVSAYHDIGDVVRAAGISVPQQLLEEGETARGGSTRGLGDATEDLLAQLRTTDGSPFVALKILSKALSLLGGDPVAPRGPDVGVDLVAWEMTLPARLTPVVFEVKRQLTPESAAATVAQAQHYLSTTDGRLAVLVLTGDIGVLTPGQIESPGRPVVAVRIEQLLLDLRTQRLGPVLLAYMANPVLLGTALNA